jgi:hypothetical protein
MGRGGGVLLQGESVNIWAEFVFEGQRNDEILIRFGGRDVPGGFGRGGLRSLSRHVVP